MYRCEQEVRGRKKSDCVLWPIDCVLSPIDADGVNEGAARRLVWIVWLDPSRPVQPADHHTASCAAYVLATPRLASCVAPPAPAPRLALAGIN